jgi:hypothetical protein
MKPRVIVVLLAALLQMMANQLRAQKIKVIVDQDARGPATTDMQSILIFCSQINLPCWASPLLAETSG